VLKFLARAIRQENQILKTRKREIKVSLFADDIILYVKDLKCFTIEHVLVGQRGFIVTFAYVLRIYLK
jgi:hypothetical protein